MPDGEPGPATPKEQIELEIAFDKAFRATTRMVGIETQPHAGGGGDSGKWIFANDQELASIIDQWERVRDSIADRRERIKRAYFMAQPPAPDLMSRLQVEAFRKSLLAMQQQAASMYTYADAYLEKLQLARAAYQTTEARNKARFEGPHG